MNKTIIYGKNEKSLNMVCYASKSLTYYELRKVYDEHSIEIERLTNDIRDDKKSEIKHGDFGYLYYKGERKNRIFMMTDYNIIESFEITRGRQSSMGGNVNNFPEKYIVTGNIFDYIKFAFY